MGGKTTIQQAPLPPAPDYSKITKESLLAQINLAPQLFAAEASPLYGQAAYANLQNQVNEILASGQMQQLAQYYPEIANIEADYLQRTRANEIAQLESPEVGLAATQQAFNQLTPGYAEAAQNMGEFAAQQTAAAAQQPGYTAYEQQVAGPTAGQFLGQIGGPSADLTLGGMQAYRPGQALAGLVGPQLQSGLGTIDQGLVQSYINQMPGVQDLAQQLTDQASEELAAGRELTPEEIRQATQSAREAYAARGTALGPQAVGAEILARAELGDQRLRERQAMAAQAANLSAQLYTPALQQALQRQMGAEQYGLGAQQQAFTQGMGQEELGRAAQGQEFTQRAGLQEMGLGLQSQAYQQALGRENLAAQTQNQAFQQALQRTQQGLAAQQALQGLQAGRAQMGAAAMGTLQQVQAPILQAFYRQPILSGSVPQQQQFALAGQQLAGPALFNPESSMAFQAAYTPYQAQVAQNIAGMQASAAGSAGKMGMIGSIGGGLLMGAGMAL